MQVISKEEARSKGLLYYCTGKPCKRGNIGPRLVSNGACRCEECKKHGARDCSITAPGNRVSAVILVRGLYQMVHVDARIVGKKVRKQCVTGQLGTQKR
jgi:hypothetical protein